MTFPKVARCHHCGTRQFYFYQSCCAYCGYTFHPLQLPRGKCETENEGKPEDPTPSDPKGSLPE